MAERKKISVVGAGVGGLAVAARLASKGHEVDVYEKLSQCGGRANLVEDKGFKFDTGPSFVLMPGFFEEVFTYCGEDIRDYLNLKVLDTSYKIFYADGDTLTVFRDSEKTKQELEKFEKGSAQKFDRFIKETAGIYRSVHPFLYRCFTPRDLFNPKYWGLLFKLEPFKTYWQLARKHFTNEKICYAMTFEAMFIGVSPFATPAFYSVISYTDHVEKIAHPMGGMYQIPLALEKMGAKFGVRFHYNAEVKSISQNGGRLKLKTKDAQTEADRIVINADYSYAREKLLGRKLPQYKYSCSVYLVYLGLKRKVKGLKHHNLFFAADLRKNLKEIFDDKVPSSDPSFYIHVPTVTDPSLAPEGKDILYLLIPVPNLDGAKADRAFLDGPLRQGVLNKINGTFHISVEDLIEVEHRFYPEDFTGRYNIKHGATFGLAHTLMQSAFLRPPNASGHHKNVYFVGASTQPGGGLPPVIASSRIVADMIAGERTA